MEQNEYIDNMIKRYAMLVRKIAYEVVKNNQNVDDIVQDTFIKVIENKDVLDEKLNVKAYISRIARNTTYDYLRQRYKQYELVTSDCSIYINEYSMWYNPYDMICNSKIDICVDKLPSKYGNVIKCIYYKEMTVKEAATYLGINQCTVRSRLFRAKNRLKFIWNNIET